MTDPQPPTPCLPAAPDLSLASLQSRAQALVGLLRLARALAAAGRPVDLDGLEQDVGRLCAGALDIADQHGAVLRGQFIVLLAEHDALAATLRDSAAAARPG